MRMTRQNQRPSVSAMCMSRATSGCNIWGLPCRNWEGFVSREVNILCSSLWPRTSRATHDKGLAIKKHTDAYALVFTTLCTCRCSITCSSLCIAVSSTRPCLDFRFRCIPETRQLSNHTHTKTNTHQSRDYLLLTSSAPLPSLFDPHSHVASCGSPLYLTGSSMSRGHHCCPPKPRRARTEVL